ncbi:MAG: glycosyl hydrolase [Leptolyngbyaceae cyanobacterium CRU_2_3]|nr:glycosyl hydrolase [Leptolyngbyaceae cyanobacterium CRU_2_3]
MFLLLPFLTSSSAVAGSQTSALQDFIQDSGRTIPKPLGAIASNLSSTSSSSTSSTAFTTAQILQQSWAAYKQRFIQADGRVVDWEAKARSTSEGQAYAMLRAVLSNDPETFALTLQWAEQNLKRPPAEQNRTDSLWSWHWGQNDQDGWEILDQNFASDADVDAATALILAGRRWNRSDYLQLAQTKLKDLWSSSTITLPRSPHTSETVRYLLPGPLKSFQPQPDRIYLNPSYFAPYAFRLFAQVDSERDWLSLVDSSYQALEESSRVSLVGLPSDWVALNTKTGKFEPLPLNIHLRSIYSFDAYRVWWRISLDANWFKETRAKTFLQEHLQPLQAMWRSNQSIPARITLLGTPNASYEATSQYAMLYPAFEIVDPAIAAEIRQQKLLPTYQAGIWDNDSAYYVQNLAWFGLFPSDEVADLWLQPPGG